MVTPVRVGRGLCGFAVVLVAGATAGCLTPEKVHYVPGVALSKELQCETQRVTGELVATKVCKFKSQRDADEQSAQDTRDFLIRQPVGACPGTPGCKN
jgi:hypothetical protein